MMGLLFFPSPKYTSSDLASQYKPCPGLAELYLRVGLWQPAGIHLQDLALKK